MSYRPSSSAALSAQLAVMEGTERLALALIASIAAVNQSLDVVTLSRWLYATALHVGFAYRVTAKEPGSKLVDVVGAITATLTRRAWECLVWITGRVRGAVPAVSN